MELLQGSIDDLMNTGFFSSSYKKIEQLDGKFMTQLLKMRPDLRELEKKEGRSEYYHKGDLQCRMPGTRLNEIIGPSRTFDIDSDKLAHILDIYASHESFKKYNVAKSFQRVVPTDGIYRSGEDYSCCYDDEYEPPTCYQNIFIFGNVIRPTTEALLGQLFDEETVKIIFSFGCSRQCLFQFHYSYMTEKYYRDYGALSVEGVFRGRFKERSGTLKVYDDCDKSFAIFVGIVLEVCKHQFKSRAKDARRGARGHPECHYFDLPQYLQAVDASPNS